MYDYTHLVLHRRQEERMERERQIMRWLADARAARRENRRAIRRERAERRRESDAGFGSCVPARSAH